MTYIYHRHATSVTVIFVGNGISDLISNPSRSFLPYTWNKYRWEDCSLALIREPVYQNESQNSKQI